MPITPSFPGSIVTDAQLKVAANRIAVKLVGGIGPGNASLVLSSLTGITANMLLSIDSEIVSIDSIVGQAVNVTRAFDGTTAASHLNGAAVSVFIDAWHHNAVVAEIKAIETYITTGAQHFVDITASPYNAVGDGVTNNTLAFANAFLSFGTTSGGGGLLGHRGGIVFVPAGDFVADIVVPSNIHLMGASKIGSNIYARADGVTVITTARGSAGVSITDLTVWLNGKQNCTAFDIKSTSLGYFARLRQVGGGDAGIAGIAGIGMRIRSVGMLDTDVVAENTFEDIDLSIAPNQAFVVGHNDDGTCRPVTLCRFRNIRAQSNGSSASLFDVVGNADTNTIDGIVLAQSLYGYGIELNSGNPPVENNVSGWRIDSVSGGGSPYDLQASGASNAVATVLTFAVPHGLYGPPSLEITNAPAGPSPWNALNGSWTGTIVSPTAISIPLNTTTFGALPSLPTVKGGGLPAPTLVNFCSYFTFGDYESLSELPYVLAHAPVGIGFDIVVGAVSGGVHVRTWQLIGGVRLGSAGNGSFIATPPNGVTLANGANHNVDIKDTSFIRVSGPTGAFSIGGFLGGVDGRELDIFVSVAFACTILNQDGGTTAGSRILTNTGADVVLRAGTSCFRVKYSASDLLWILMSSN